MIKHLKMVLEENNTVTTDFTGYLYCGITMKWYNIKYTVDLFIPGYMVVSLYRFQQIMNFI
jgi:hypothetical protein